MLTALGYGLVLLYFPAWALLMLLLVLACCFMALGLLRTPKGFYGDCEVWLRTFSALLRKRPDALVGAVLITTLYALAWTYLSGLALPLIMLGGVIGIAIRLLFPPKQSLLRTPKR